MPMGMYCFLRWKEISIFCILLPPTLESNIKKNNFHGDNTLVVYRMCRGWQSKMSEIMGNSKIVGLQKIFHLYWKWKDTGQIWNIQKGSKEFIEYIYLKKFLSITL